MHTTNNNNNKTKEKSIEQTEYEEEKTNSYAGNSDIKNTIISKKKLKYVEMQKKEDIKLTKYMNVLKQYFPVFPMLITLFYIYL